MLEGLETEKIDLACVDVVDESAAQQTLTKTRKNIEKLKDQPSKIACLETVLSLAVGCRVMLRRNIDVTLVIRALTKLTASEVSFGMTGIIDDGEPCSKNAKVSVSHVQSTSNNVITKFNVKDDDSCSSLIVSIKLSMIICKPKDDKTKCVVKNDHCGSSLIVSIKLSSIKLTTSNSKKDDDIIFTYEEPPNPDIVRRRQRDYVYYPDNEEFQRRWCEILNLKFVTAARFLPCSPTTPLSDERVPNSTLDVPGDGNCFFMPIHISLLGQFLSNTNYVKQLLVICQTLKKNCLM
uniref:OTU domain-containing protein n=1 Tax=Amphimedon queenslandica TaxID=400682 RepID=A0A1X7UW92_AMPQE